MTNVTTEDKPLDAIMDHDVIVFAKSRCPQCDQTKRVMRKNGIDFHEMDLENEQIRLMDQDYKTAYEFVTQTLKAEAAPIVLVKENRMAKGINTPIYLNFSFWTGFRSDFIKAIQPDTQD